MAAEIDRNMVITPGESYSVPTMRYMISGILEQSKGFRNRDTYVSILDVLNQLPDTSMVHIAIDPGTQNIELMGSF